jgi:quercetin dioxygenase-like cupin family protein
MKWRVIRDDERYLVKDLTLDGLTVSHTTLHPNQSTKGHSHPHREAYYFMTPADVLIGSHWESVLPGDIRVVPSNYFHQVSNKSPTKDVEFYAIFSGFRDESRYKIEVENDSRDKDDKVTLQPITLRNAGISEFRPGLD